MNERATDILIVGAGPAGLAAARAASSAPGRPRITIADENDGPGGQIWRRSAPRWARDLVARGAAANLELVTQTAVLQRDHDGSFLAVQGHERHEPLRIRAAAVILATGARELFLPFPGWTLPGVMGVGGLQALVKSGLEVAGKRIVVAGSGPLLIAVAACLHRAGAHIPAVVEQAPPRAVRGFALRLIRHPGKLVQAAVLRTALVDVPYLTGAWITRAAPGADHNAVGSVTVRRVTGSGPRDVEYPCDLVACGYGLVPNTHLASVLGCRIADGAVEVDEVQRTSNPGIFCAGESAGIGGVETALAEGAVAGYAAAGDLGAAHRASAARTRARSFADALHRAFALRPQVIALADDRTICCRCEDVVLGDLRRYTSWREAKLQTRCGMGPCQGRVCGPIARRLLGFDPVDARPPVYPVALGVLAGGQPAPPAEHTDSPAQAPSTASTRLEAHD